jgi:protein-disulfide isomerase
MSETKKFELTPSLSILIAGVIIAGAIIFTNVHGAAAVSADSPQAPTAATHVHAPLANEHIIGSPTAPLVLIEYSDFQCPYCSMVYPTLKKIVADSNGQIAWVLRNFPLESIHPNARPGALAAECIAAQLGNDAYWKFADTIFGDQSKISLGVQKAAYETCLTSPATAKIIDDSVAEVEQNGGQGTPYTILFDSKGQTGVSGALPAATFSAVIKAFQTRQ